MAKIPTAFLFEPKDLVPYETAWFWQRKWRERLLEKPFSKQAVWILQHQSCYTMGRSGSYNNLLFDLNDDSFEFHRVDRGGEVTHHLPGQLVVYPVLDLHRYETDLHWYLRELEQVIIDVVYALGLRGERVTGMTGVWVEGKKIAAIGVGCRRWITQHGFSINVNCQMDGFSKVVPCGLVGHPVEKLNAWIPGLTTDEVQPLIRNSFSKRFRLNLYTEVSLQHL